MIVVIAILIVLLIIGCWCWSRQKKVGAISVSAELEEELFQKELAVRGSVPEWLGGTLVRNGPVMVSAGGKRVEHWLDGLGMLHAFRLEKGRVFYSNRYLRSKAYNRVFKEGSIDYLSFAADPCRSWFSRYFAAFRPSMGEPIKNANVNVAKMADQFVAMTEIPLPVRFDIKTLETLGVFDFDDHLPKERCFESAHPHYDSRRKELVSYLVDYGKKSVYEIFRIRDGSNRRELIAQIPVDEPAYMHSFALTENYVIFTEFPLVVNPIDFFTKGKPFIKNFVWKPERGTQFLVVERGSGKLVGQYSAEPFFAFHHANAYEKGQEIVIDVVAYADPSIIAGLADYVSVEGSPEKAKAINDCANSCLKRFNLSLPQKQIASSILFNEPLEFPRINDQFFDGRMYKYLYALDPRVFAEGVESLKLFKIGVEDHRVLSWSEKECQPGEPVFVSRPGASEEDDGVVLSVVLDRLKGSSFLLILDGKTFEEIGRAEVPHQVPVGLHGQYFSN